mgnify:CR=1 FL=1
MSQQAKISIFSIFLYSIKGAVSEMIFKIISVDGLFIFYSYIYMKLFLNEQVF